MPCCTGMAGGSRGRCRGRAGGTGHDPRVNFRYYDGKFRNILEVFERVNPSAGHGPDTDGQC